MAADRTGELLGARLFTLGKLTVRITAVTTTGRKALSKRTHRTCAPKRTRKKR